MASIVRFDGRPGPSDKGAQIPDQRDKLLNEKDDGLKRWWNGGRWYVTYQPLQRCGDDRRPFSSFELTVVEDFEDGRGKVYSVSIPHDLDRQFVR